MLPGGTHNPFEPWGTKQGDAEYCSICQMNHDVTDDNQPCDHLEWCDECGLWMGEGAYDSCEHNAVSDPCVLESRSDIHS